MFPQKLNELRNSDTLVSNLDAIPHYLLCHSPFYFCVGPTMQPRIMCASDTGRFLHRHRVSLKPIVQSIQVVRMKISGHKTDSMERRYNIVDVDDLSIAKEFMERRMKAALTVT